jgi:hypothetical protein
LLLAMVWLSRRNFTAELNPSRKRMCFNNQIKLNDG